MSKLHNAERFKHVDYMRTDVKRTFARERKRLAKEKAATAKVVTPIKRRKAA